MPFKFSEMLSWLKAAVTILFHFQNHLWGQWDGFNSTHPQPSFFPVDIFFSSIALFGTIPDLLLANFKDRQKRCLQVSLSSKLIINNVAIKLTLLPKAKWIKMFTPMKITVFLVFSESCLDLKNISTLEKIFTND